MIDSGVFNSSNFRNGVQYFARIDKAFKKDRIYASFFRTTLDFGGPAVIPQFSTTNHTTQSAIQVNWTHTFSPTTLNELIYGQNRVEGFLGETGDFTIPGITVTGQSVGYGVGFAQGNFIQHNYHWRDVLTHVRGAHVLKVGYEGWFGDDVEPFQGPWSHPGFSFDNLLKLAQDAPQTQGGVMYNPNTGQQQLWDWNAASKTWGAFVQDTWKARRNLTLTLGLRFDNQGNPYSRSDSTVFGNFLLGTGSTFEEQVANGVARASEHALNNSPKVWNPRAGVAWDVNGKGDWLVRGGLGFYPNWLTPANIQEQFRGNPPGLILPTFFANSPSPPIFTQGTGSTPPFGFTFPGLAGTSLCPTGSLSRREGRDQGCRVPDRWNQPGHQVSQDLHLFGDVGAPDRQSPGGQPALQRISLHRPGLRRESNRSGQLRDEHQCPARRPAREATGSAPTRLNSSFGAIAYSENDRESNYNGITFDLRGQFKRAFFDVSYTPLLFEGRRRCLPDVGQPAPVLRAVSVGRSQSLLAQRQLRVPRLGPVERRLGGERNQHLSEWLALHGHQRGLVHRRRRLQRRWRQPRLPQRDRLWARERATPFSPVSSRPDNSLRPLRGRTATSR